HLNGPTSIILRTRSVCSATSQDALFRSLGPWIAAFAGMSGVCFAVSAISLKFSHHPASWHALRDRRQPISIRVPSKESKPMKPGLRPGASRVNRITIGPERTISFMGEDARTYATPAMIRDIEYTCRDLILEHADPSEDSVGMEVAVKHLAPTLLGMTV